MEQVMADKVGGIDYLAKALAAMGGIALVLALMGIYSLVAYLAARRTQEIGVRIALGATRWQVIRLNVHQALVITGLGLAIGHRAGSRAGPRDGVRPSYGLVSLRMAAGGDHDRGPRSDRARRRTPAGAPRRRARPDRGAADVLTRLENVMTMPPPSPPRWPNESCASPSAIASGARR